MCGVGNDMDVKYRVRSINAKEAEVEFLISKDKQGERKVIAAPVVLVKNATKAQNITTSHKANILVSVERVR